MVPTVSKSVGFFLDFNKLAVVEMASEGVSF